jgi:hypothetical protein
VSQCAQHTRTRTSVDAYLELYEPEEIAHAEEQYCERVRMSTQFAQCSHARHTYTHTHAARQHDSTVLTGNSVSQRHQREHARHHARTL